MIIETTELLKTRRFRVVNIREKNGDRISERQVVRHPGAVTVIPMVDENHVCLIENYRVAVDQTLIELPAGTLEPDEQPEASAARELLEETGYRAGRIEKLLEFHTSPGVMDEKMWLFVATDLQFQGAEREVGEQIENLVVTWDEAIAMASRVECEMPNRSLAFCCMTNCAKIIE